jgi:hypothetical protein
MNGPSNVDGPSPQSGISRFDAVAFAMNHSIACISSSQTA